MKYALLAALAIGFLDPNCTIDQVCTPNYTKTVRPSSSYTNKLKRKQMDSLGLPGDMSEYEEDHIVPLVLCGHPTDPRNLVPQPWDRARKKDVLEVRFRKDVCKGKMSLKEAQEKIITYE